MDCEGDIAVRLQRIYIVFMLLFTIIFMASTPRSVAVAEERPGVDGSGITGEPENIIVPFVTLRNRTGSSELADYFGGSRGEINAGICRVSFSPLWGLEDLAESVPFYIPDEKIELTGIEEISLETQYRNGELISRQHSKHLVLYFHGYNTDFEKSCRLSALFQRSLDLKDRSLLFSWPADGNMLKYTWDEADLVWSVPYMARFFEELESRIGSGRMDLVAHSLGARGAVQALIRMAYRQRREPLLNELVLVAPDIDADIFQHELPLLRSMVRRITVYVSDNDKALRLSEEVHGASRLGQAGDHLRVLEGVEIVDISALDSRRISGHLYHLFNPEVIDDLWQLLHFGIPAADRFSLQPARQDDVPYWRLIPKDS